ncbi:MAG: hypothetical protein EP319_04615 [Deltaproteobacteria bacterium]|nr:MAG: hypothetical protein EP319_04615 [Deltaproteobacteria bacterium]
MIKKILLVITSTFFSLLIIEGIARIFVHPNYSKMDYQYQIDEELIYKHRPYFKGLWKTKEFTEVIELNSKGYRNPENSPDKKKVLFLGDSMVFGHGVNFEKTFAHLVSEKIKDHEMINSAVKGYGLDQSYMLFDKLLKEENVSKIYVGIHLNDVYDSFVKRRFEFNGKHLVLIKNKYVVYAKLFIGYYKSIHKYFSSRSLQYVFSKYLEIRVADESEKFFNATEQKVKLFEIVKQMIQKAKDSQVEIKFVLMPLYESSEEKYAWLTQNIDASFFILPEGFSKQDFLSDQIHLNEAGHEKMKNLILGKKN